MSGMELFGHGGDLVTASTIFGLKSDEFIDFSSNINPLGPPPEVNEILTRQWGEVQHYPDPAHRSFRRLLSAALQVNEQSLLIGNGAAECMALAILGLSPNKIGVIHPGFSEYASLACNFDIPVLACYGKEEKQFQPDVNEVRTLMHKVDMLFVGHPNNPTGICFTMEQLLDMARTAEETGTFLIVDEAFLDFIPPEQQVTLIQHLPNFPHVIIVRSMTKFYAIPGLRLGYALAHPEIITRMKRKQVPWSVNQFALLAGEASISASAEYEQETRSLIAQERTYLTEQLKSRFGWGIFPGQANFLLIRTPIAIKASDLQRQLGEQGILIRSCAMYPGLSEQYFRIAVKKREHNEKLLQALAVVVRRRELG